MILDRNMKIADMEIGEIVLFTDEQLLKRIGSLDFAVNIMNRTLNIDEPEIIPEPLEYPMPFVPHTHIMKSNTNNILYLHIPHENISIFQTDKITFENTFETHLSDIYEILIDNFPFEIEANQRVIKSAKGEEIMKLYDTLKWLTDITLEDTETLFNNYELIPKND